MLFMWRHGHGTNSRWHHREGEESPAQLVIGVQPGDGIHRDCEKLYNLHYWGVCWEQVKLFIRSETVWLSQERRLSVFFVVQQWGKEHHAHRRGLCGFKPPPTSNKRQPMLYYQMFHLCVEGEQRLWTFMCQCQIPQNRVWLHFTLNNYLKRIKK